MAGIIIVMLCGVVASRSPVAASLRQGNPLSGLLMGIDRVEEARHSDTLMLWQYDPLRSRVDVLSIPRDTKIDLPGYRFHRINEVFAYHYGVKRRHDIAAGEVMSAVDHLLRLNGETLTPSHFFLVDYGGFHRIIDLLGGIEVHIDEPMHYDDNAGQYHFHKEPGDYSLRGEEALAYVRFRGKSGDRGRILRQMDFLRSMVGRLCSPLTLCRWPRMLMTVCGSVHTNVRLWDVAFLALEAKHLRPSEVNPWLLPGRPSGAYWEMDAERTALVLSQIRASGKPEFQSKTQVQKEAKSITVKVWNGAGRGGLALSVARRLRAEKFDVLEWGTYERRQKRTRVLDRVGTIEKARDVARVLGVESVFSDVDPALRTDVEVVLGEDFK
ncbi:MAG: LCP family protein [Elusimicrobia bacterium]|nr:LCP family protein [Elusimicrobiota bacterium]